MCVIAILHLFISIHVSAACSPAVPSLTEGGKKVRRGKWHEKNTCRKQQRKKGIKKEPVDMQRQIV
jgi:hypothetical protein